MRYCWLGHADGGLVVGSSQLTNRLWTGELLYFNSCTKDTALTDRDVGVLLDCGVSDVKWIGTTQRFVAACDSGTYTIVGIGGLFGHAPSLELRKISHLAKNATLEKLPQWKITKIVVTTCQILRLKCT